MSANLIKALIPHLPRFAEEEGDFYSVTREYLINALCLENKIEQAVAENTVDLIENLLNSLAVLNSYYLQKGDWCFVSFPAQLLAMSILTTMSDKKSRFFADNFWKTDSISDFRKKEQRNILMAIEHKRHQHHTSDNAPPIRYIYVAWGIIKLNDNILFYQRGIKEFNKKIGDYSLTGGRLNQYDIDIFSDNLKRCLEILQSENIDIQKNIPKTLERQLTGKIGLIFDKHYNYTPWRSLKPYSQVSGTAPVHALTKYFIEIFHINLTLEGYLFLQQKIKSDERLVWFSMADIEKAETADKKIAYIKALFNDFYDDRAALIANLKMLPDSFISNYLSRYGITLLQNTDKPLLKVSSGKETQRPVDIVLTAQQQQLLLGLAAHNRGFEFAQLAENIVLHPYGWIELQANIPLQKELIELAVIFQQTEFVIENDQDCFFRLSIKPSSLYFDAILFTYSVQQTELDTRKIKIPISITRAALSTALGVIAEKTESFSIPLDNLAKRFQKIIQQEKLDFDIEQIEDSNKNKLLKDDRFLALGLKSLLRRKDGVIEFCAAYQVIT